LSCRFLDQYLNEKLAGNVNSEDSSKSTPKKKKGHSELLEKSPVTPPDVLHDTECRFLDHQHDFHLYYHFPYQIHYSNRLHDQRMILFYIPIVCVPELHKYGIANRNSKEEEEKTVQNRKP
jgi:hypothetical protein